MFHSDGKLMRLMNWITRFIYLQILWILFSLLGLVVGGLFPSTFTMFGISRKWMREHTDFPLFRTFLEMFRESFFKANMLGWGMSLFAFSIYFYYRWFNELTGILPTVLIGILVVLGFSFLVISLFIIPVYAHFNVSLLNVIKHAALIAISHPLHAVAMAIILVVFWYIMIYWPIVFLFIGVSFLAYALMGIANAAFNNIERKLER